MLLIPDEPRHSEENQELREDAMPLKTKPLKTRFRRYLPTVISSTIIIWLLVATLGIAPSAADTTVEEDWKITALKFSTGILSAYALHEFGHAASGYLTGTDIEWGLGTYNQPLGFEEDADSDTDGMILHASGLITQLVTSEIILQADSIDNNDSFVRGMMFWNIINPIIYSLDYWFIRRTNQETETRYQGDIEGFEHYSNDTSANIFAAGMFAIAAYQGYRFIKTQTWAPQWMQRDDVRLNLQTSGRKGMALMVEIDF